MIDTKSMGELKDFFDNLPRPLPQNLLLNAATTVTDPETFIAAQLSVLQHRKDSTYSEVVLARLLRWKELYTEAVKPE